MLEKGKSTFFDHDPNRPYSVPGMTFTKCGFRANASNRGTHEPRVEGYRHLVEWTPDLR